MSALVEQVFEKYFGYRRRYVEHILREAPQRAVLAVLSEAARLGFMIAGNALCALILWALAFGAYAQRAPIGWAVLFSMLALLPTTFALLAAAGFGRALGDRARVEEGARRAANVPRP